MLTEDGKEFTGLLEQLNFCHFKKHFGDMKEEPKTKDWQIFIILSTMDPVKRAQLVTKISEMEWVTETEVMDVMCKIMEVWSGGNLSSLKPQMSLLEKLGHGGLGFDKEKIPEMIKEIVTSSEAKKGSLPEMVLQYCRTTGSEKNAPKPAPTESSKPTTSAEPGAPTAAPSQGSDSSAKLSAKDLEAELHLWKKKVYSHENVIFHYKRREETLTEQNQQIITANKTINEDIKAYEDQTAKVRTAFDSEAKDLEKKLAELTKENQRLQEATVRLEIENEESDQTIQNLCSRMGKLEVVEG